MKNNIFGYLFIIFIIGIMVYAVYKVNQEENVQDGQISSSYESEENSKITEIKLGIAEFDNINPILTNNSNVQYIDKLIYEPLIDITEDYNTKPCLATEWAKQDATTYIIKLREGVKWSDGGNFNAYDVQYTIDRLKENSSLPYFGNVAEVQEVNVVDDYTIRLILFKEVPFFEYNLCFPILSKNYYGEDDFFNTEKNNAPIGTGKYKIVNREGTSIILEKNSNWWNNEEEILLEKITINMYSSISELYNAFKLGGIDFICTNNPNYQDYIGTIGYNKKEFFGREYTFLTLNTQSAILWDSSARKAISRAIDKNSIVSNIYGDMYSVANFPIISSWTLDNSNDESKYNPEEVTNILSSSGWVNYGTTWQKIENYKTVRLNLKLVVKNSDYKKVLVAEEIKSQLESQGFKINIVKASDEEYNNYLNNKNYDMILCGTYMPIGPDLTTYFGEGNLANYYTDQTNEIMKVLANSTDKEILKGNYKMLYDIFENESLYVGICRNKTIVASGYDLVSNISSNWYNLFYNIGTWYKQ